MPILTLDPITGNDLGQSVDAILGDLNQFPDSVFVAAFDARHACFYDCGVHGLAVFETQGEAKAFGDTVEPNVRVDQVTFDEAREIAKSKPQLVAVFLMDLRSGPTVRARHYVR
jgi:hypothetical protein